jgi:hypothetical protein
MCGSGPSKRGAEGWVQERSGERVQVQNENQRFKDCCYMEEDWPMNRQQGIAEGKERLPILVARSLIETREDEVRGNQGRAAHRIEWGVGGAESTEDGRRRTEGPREYTTQGTHTGQASKCCVETRVQKHLKLMGWERKLTARYRLVTRQGICNSQRKVKRERSVGGRE